MNDLQSLLCCWFFFPEMPFGSFLVHMTEARTAICTLPGQVKFSQLILAPELVLTEFLIHILFFKVLSCFSSHRASALEPQKTELEKAYYITCSTFFVLEDEGDLILKTILNLQDFSMISLI